MEKPKRSSKPKNIPENSSPRSKRFDVFLTDEQKHLFDTICDDIKKYREVARKCFAMSSLAQIVASDGGFDKNGRYVITPDNEAVGKILNIGFGKSNMKRLYELKKFSMTEGAPGWQSYVTDSVREAAATAGRSKDPEFPKANRDWLILQFARRIGAFNNLGIKCQFTSAHPKLDHHHIAFKWNKDIGTVNFKVPKLDGGSWVIWKNLVDGVEGWQMGAFTLNQYEKSEGTKKYRQFCIDVTYYKPDRKATIDPKKSLVVEFTDDQENFIASYIDGEKDVFKADKMSAVEVVGWLNELLARSTAIQARKKAAGNPRRSWGDAIANRSLRDRLGRITAQRDNGQKHRNHLWTRRIIDQAIRCEAGNIIIVGQPGNSTLFGHPWGWYQFNQFLKYKAKEIGIEIQQVDLAKAA